MARQFQLRRGVTSDIKEFIGAEGELIYNTQTKELSVHDGITKGGSTFPTLTGGKIPLSQLPTASVQQEGVTILADTITSSRTDYALTANQGKVLAERDFGVGQTWQNVTNSRVSDTTYTNTSTRPIEVQLSIQDPQQFAAFSVTVGGVVIIDILDFGASGTYLVTFTVPAGASYSVRMTTNIIRLWAEMR